jgi:hypothetical protein
MYLINGQKYFSEFQSLSKSALIFKTTDYKLKKTLTTDSGKHVKTKNDSGTYLVSIVDLSKIYNTRCDECDPDTTAEMNIIHESEHTEMTDTDGQPQTPETAVAPEYYEGDADYLYIVLSNGKILDQWETEPTDADIAMYGAGGYVVKMINADTQKLCGIKKYNIQREIGDAQLGSDDPLQSLARAMETFTTLNKKITPPADTKNPETMIIAMMKQQSDNQMQWMTLLTTMLTNMMQRANPQATAAESPLDFLIKLKNAGLINTDGAGGDNSVIESVIEKVGNLVDALAPSIAAKLSGIPGLPAGTNFDTLNLPDPMTNIRPVGTGQVATEENENEIEMIPIGGTNVQQ